MDLIFVGIGGALGSMVRYKAGKIISGKYRTAFPFGTFLINITGAILLGIVSGLDSGRNIYLLLGDGFLGAYTTFSTFMYESFQLFKENKKLNALTYILSSLFLGILGYTIGFYLAQ